MWGSSDGRFFRSHSWRGRLRPVFRVRPIPLSFWGNKVVTILSSIRQRLFPVQDTVLKRDHHFIKFTEQRHPFGNTEISRIGTDWTAGNAVVTGTLVRLPDEIHLE